MAISITATKAGRSGAPAAQIVFDAGTKLDAILAAQKALFADRKLAKVIGLKFCPGCYSGLDLDIRQKYEAVVEGF